MTLGVGRGMNLNFATLAMLLAAAQSTKSFDVGTLANLTGFHENKVKGHQSWARAMRLLEGIELTPLAYRLLDRDPMLTQPLSRGVCYVEISSNPHAEVAYHICRVVLPRISAIGINVTTEELVTSLVADGVGVSANAAGQPKRDAELFLSSLKSIHGFRALGLLHQNAPGYYAAGATQLEPELTGYALLRCWPENTPYLRIANASRLVAPLLLSPARFEDHMALLEQRGLMSRVTSSGLDQIRPIADDPVEALWPAR